MGLGCTNLSDIQPHHTTHEALAPSAERVAARHRSGNLWLLVTANGGVYTRPETLDSGHAADWSKPLAPDTSRRIATGYAPTQFLLLAGALLALIPVWFRLVAHHLAVVVYTGGYRADLLWAYCQDNSPSTLPPNSESNVPIAEIQELPIRYSCTYTQVLPHVTVVHTDLLGTAVALLPLLALVVYVFGHVCASRRSRPAGPELAPLGTDNP